jgi:serine beta-lactamase-like protein LACTB
MTARFRWRMVRTAVPLVALLSLATAPLVGQRLSPGLQPKIEELVRQEMARQKIPGLSIAVAERGRLAWSAGFGLADIENRVPVKAETVFRLGSISKPITAVAAMQLWEEGKLDLDAPVQKYVPSFPEKPWPITPRQLLAHLGGIRHYNTREEVDSTSHYTDSLAPLGVFRADPLVAEPGTGFHYTTFGYVLLGVVVESAAAVPFVEHLKARVFAPAAMETARDDHVYDLIPNRARGYALRPDGSLRNANLADTSNKIAGGGMASTAVDLVKFALAVRANTLLKPATVSVMFTPQKTAGAETIRYGLGWYVDPVGGRPAAYHGGSQQGVHTFLVMLPRDGTVVALMCNLEGTSLSNLGQRLALLVTDAGR